MGKRIALTVVAVVIIGAAIYFTQAYMRGRKLAMAEALTSADGVTLRLATVRIVLPLPAPELNVLPYVISKARI